MSSHMIIECATGNVKCCCGAPMRLNDAGAYECTNPYCYIDRRAV